MSVLRIEGYVIISADGMLANSDRVMPDALKFEGDQSFFTLHSIAPISSFTGGIRSRINQTPHAGRVLF